MGLLADRRIVVEGNAFAVYFPYPRDATLADRIKKVSQRAYRTPPSRWLVPMLESPAHDLLAFADRYFFTVSPDARQALTRLTSGERPADRRIWLDDDGRSFGIAFVNVPSEDWQSIVGDARAIEGPEAFDPERRAWFVTASLANAPALREMIRRWSFHVEESAARLLDAIDGQVRQHESERSHARGDRRIETFVSRKGDRLYAFQKDGAEYIEARRRVMLCDDVGLGKTVQALAGAWLLDAFPMIVVCQSDLRIKWSREVINWLPGKSIKVVQGRRDSIPRADVIILSHEVLSAYTAQLARVNPQMICIDEAHKLKTMTAARTKAGVALAASAPNRVLMSATPMPNRPAELRAPLTILGRLDDFGGWQAFANRYCRSFKKTITRWQHGRRVTRTIIDSSGSNHETELHRRLVSTCYLRRSKDEVLDQLPAKVYTTVPVEIDNRAEYDRARDAFLDWIEERALSDEAYAARVAHLPERERDQAIALHAEQKRENVARMIEQQRMAALKQLTEAGKISHVVALARSFLEESDGKLYISAYSVDVQDRLAMSFPGCARISSHDSLRDRQANVDRFQVRDDCRILIASLMAGQTGHDLTAAKTMWHVGYGWRPMDFDQMEGRAWGRMNDLHGLDVSFIVGVDTVEEDILELVSVKRRRVDAIVDGKESSEDANVYDEVMARMRARARERANDQQPALDLLPA